MRHGKSNTRLYRIWSGMKDRCYNANSPNYKHYGGRGIKMCDEWKHDFMAFYTWAMGNGYDETAPRGQYTIERKDNDGDYCPNNCRWATTQEQLNNKRNNRMVTDHGEATTLSQWCKEHNANYRRELYKQVKSDVLNKKRDRRRAAGGIPRDEYLTQHEDKRNQMLEIIKQHPELSVRRLAEITGYSKTSVQRAKSVITRGEKNPWQTQDRKESKS